MAAHHAAMMHRSRRDHHMAMKSGHRMAMRNHSRHDTMHRDKS
jgi:hypothetical protein